MTYVVGPFQVGSFNDRYLIKPIHCILKHIGVVVSLVVEVVRVLASFVAIDAL